MLNWAFHLVRRPCPRSWPAPPSPPQQPAVILTGVLATAVGPLAGTRSCATHASQFFTDTPLACCWPARQDT